MLTTLADFESPEEATEFINIKVQSILAAKSPNLPEENFDSLPFKSASDRFRNTFPLCKDEKLVSYYSCSVWKGKLPSRGWLYLTENNLGFHSFVFGKECKLLLRWTDVIKVEKSNNYLKPDTIRLATRDKDFYFGMFLNRTSEAFEIIRQLADLAMRKLMDEDAGRSILGKKNPYQMNILS